MVEDSDMERDFGGFFNREFSDFTEDGGMGDRGDGGPRGGGGGPPFRGSNRGGGPWRGGRGGRGHFDNGFGPRGPPPPRFRGGRGGFMGPNMRGPGPRGPGGPGFRGGGHFERPFRHQNWQNNGPPPQHMGHGPPEHMGPNDELQETIWAEARSETGTSYFYNTKTRVTSWDRPEGPGVIIMSHEEWSASVAMKGPGPNNEGSRFSGPDAQNNQGSPFQGQGPPSGQGMSPGFGPRPQLGGPPANGSQGNSMQGPPGPAAHGVDFQLSQGLVLQIEYLSSLPEHELQEFLIKNNNAEYVARPQMQMGTGPSQGGPFGAPHFRPPGPAGFSPGENRAPGVDEKKDSGALGLKIASIAPQQPPIAQQPPISQQPPGFPPFGPMTTPPPFGVPFSQNFMVPPPWNPMAGGPPPTGVPPPLITPVDPIVQQMDPQIVGRAFEWSEHVAPDGKSYFFNAKTQTSVWEKPAPLLEFETAKVIAQQRLMQQAIMNASKDKLVLDRNEYGLEAARKMDAEARKVAAMNEKCRPVSSTPVSGTPWCVVWTGDKRVFFYNPSTKTSVWDKPPDLVGRLDVDELLRSCPSTKMIPFTAMIKKAEATSTTEPIASANLPVPSAILNVNTEVEKSEGPKSDNKIIINLDKRSRDKEEPPGDPPLKKAKRDSESDDDIKEIITIEDDDKIVEKKDPLKDVNNLEAEVKAARERATVPLETRLQQFKDMLSEKQVSAFSTWEKELHKIVFDSRYLLLTSKERKAAFENYVKERAEEERKEKKSRLKQVKEHFKKFLEDIHVNQKVSFNEFVQKHARDDRYKAVEKSRDREAYFAEFVADIKRREKEAKSHKKDKVKEDFSTALQEKIRDYHLKWQDVRKKIDDSRFEILDLEEKEELFRIFQKKLKLETKYKEKKRKKKLKKDKRDREKLGRSREEIQSEKLVEEVESEAQESIKSGCIESDKMEDVSDEEEEEGMISDDTDDEIRARRQRTITSLREREKEVHRTLANHLRDRDKEREFYRHEEGIQEFQALLTDLVRNNDMSWKDAKKSFKRDRRWESVEILSREEMEHLFNQHLVHVARKKKLRFRDLLEEAKVKLNSTWRDVKKKIKEDPRFQKYSADDRKCEREFAVYLKDLTVIMKSDFRALLKETKMLTYKTKHQIRENPLIMKDIEALLEKDKRFLNLDCMADDRHRLLVEYLDELERKGPPPPPTASEPSRRLK